jgi:hypothetical protein
MNTSYRVGESDDRHTDRQTDGVKEAFVMTNGEEFGNNEL